MQKMKNILSRYFLICLAFFTSLLAHSQSPVYAQVSAKKVQAGTPFAYAVAITVNANSYNAPNFKDFDVVNGPNQSQSTQIINGAVSSQLTLSWGLVARKEGKY